MPIQREGEFLWTHDLGIGSSLGVESVRLDACVAEAAARRPDGVFGHPGFGFAQDDLDFLARLPWLVQVWFWDVALRSVEGLYALGGLRRFGVHPERPAVDFARFPVLEHVVWIHEPRDRGLADARSVRELDLWHYKPRSKRFAGLELPPGLDSLALYWANPASLAGIPELPRLRSLEIHRCRSLASLDALPRIAPKLERLVVTASGRLADVSALADLPRLRLALHDGRDLLAAAPDEREPRRAGPADAGATPA